MNRKHRAGLCLGALLFLSLVAGCGTLDTGPDSIPGEADLYEDIKQALYANHERFGGVRYRYGGMSERGFDCSGFTSVVYLESFNLSLPRTTEDQSKKGRSVNRGDLKPGDLVFFKIRFFQKHVGIYVEDGWFLHASRSKGVTLSRLSDKYWRKRYWKARRLLPENPI